MRLTADKEVFKHPEEMLKHKKNQKLLLRPPNPIPQSRIAAEEGLGRWLEKGQAPENHATTRPEDRG